MRYSAGVYKTPCFHRYSGRFLRCSHAPCPRTRKQPCRKPSDSTPAPALATELTSAASAEQMGGLTLAGTTTLMFLGSYLAGLLPLTLKIRSAEDIKFINANGAGLLLGAALCVVLPEGFLTFLEAQEKLEAASRYPEWLLGLSLLLGFLTMVGVQAVAEQWEQQAAPAPAQVRPGSHLPRPHSSGVAPAPGSLAQLQRSGGLEEQQELLELRSAGAPSSSSASVVCGLEVAGAPASPPASLSAADQALYGLVIHSAADGIAVGAACLSNSLALTASIGAAILIHKFPVAFGLSSFLRGAGWQGPRLQKGLLLFCAAAPLAAIVMYLVFGRVAAITDERTVAMCLLFSGGTVLHAGLVHVLPSVLGSSDGAQRGHDHGGGEDEHGRLHAHGGRTKPMVLAMLVLSSFVPLIIAALLPET